MTEAQQEDLLDEHEDCTDNDSDDISLFRYVGEEGDGTVSELCALCQSVLDNWVSYEIDPDFTFTHHNTVPQLEEAAAAGCALCQQLVNSWPRHSRNHETGLQIVRKEYDRPGWPTERSTMALELRLPPYYVPSYYDQQSNNEDIKVLKRKRDQTAESQMNDIEGEDENSSWADHDYDYIDDDRRQISSEFTNIFRVDMFPARNSASLSQSRHSNRSSSRESINQAERWLRRCQKSHSKCTNSIGNFMPTRLIHIGKQVSRLCLANDISGSCQYATLSHCWGATKFVTLSTKNIELFRSQIPQEALSQTIKDAIDVAQQLGFSYLWVDTLCIVQDDARDWAQESSTMSAVYGSSHLNIAASGAINGSVGCFFNRPPHWRCQAEVSVQGSESLYDFVASPFAWTTLSRMPLMQRAWAFQERLLSPRTLHFTQTEVFWECFHKSACESFPDETPWQCTLTQECFVKQPLVPSMWAWVVETYSNCDLTFPQDKLVAISGLARHIQQQTRDQYVAGMWRDGIEFQLCWITEFPDSAEQANDRQIDCYVAPSWSWASLGSTASLLTLDEIQKAKNDATLWIAVIGVDLKLSGTDPLGSLSYGKLRLSCTMLVRTRATIVSVDGVDYILLGGEKVPCAIHYDIQDHDAKEEYHDAYALPVFGTFPSVDIHGLLLERTGNRKGVYRRVGRFHCLDKEYSSGEFERVTAALAHKVSPEDCYEIRLDRFGKQCHIIHLV